MAKTDEKTKQANIVVARTMRMNGGGIVLQSAEDLKLAAELFQRSGLCPSWCDTPTKAAFVVEAGLELGFKPVQSLQNLQLVKGQLGIKAAAIGGLIRSSPVCKTMTQRYEGTYPDDEFRAVVISQRKDDPEIHTTTFSIADAKTAELWSKDNWQHYPKNMLMWRALSNHGRQFYGDVICGFYTAEELADIHPPQEQATPEVASREQRKQIEDPVIRDSTEALQEQIKITFAKFVATLETPLCLDRKLDDVPEPVIWQAFAKLAEAVLPAVAQDEPVDYTKPTSHTIAGLTYLQAHIEHEGIPDDIVALIPVPMTEAQVNQEADRMFPEDAAEEAKTKKKSRKKAEAKG